MSAAKPNTVDRILELLEGHEQQRSLEALGADVVPAACWRCDARPPAGDLGLCPPCRDALEGDEPRPFDARKVPDSPLIAYLREEFEAAHLARMMGGDPSPILEGIEPPTALEEFADAMTAALNAFRDVVVPTLERILDVFAELHARIPHLGEILTSPRRETTSIRDVARPPRDLRTTEAHARHRPTLPRRRR